MGAACSGIAGVVALLLDRRAAPAATDAVAPPVPAPGAPPVPAAPIDAPASVAPSTADPAKPPRDRFRLALTLAFLSGVTSLGYQVVWNRLLGAGTGSSTYVFTIILVLFLIGIATGAILLGFVRPRVKSVVG